MARDRSNIVFEEYDIKLNGINHSAYNNTITARSINISTGGLYQGIQLTSTITTPVESLHTVYGNSITGPVIGINHDVQAADTTHKYVAHIDENKVYDTYAPASPVASNDGTGIIVSKNAKVRGNSIYRTKYCAISVNSPPRTRTRMPLRTGRESSGATAWLTLRISVASTSAPTVKSVSGSEKSGQGGKSSALRPATLTRVLA